MSSYGIKFLHVRCTEFERNIGQRTNIRYEYKYVGIKKTGPEEETEFLTSFSLLNHKSYYLVIGRFDQNNKFPIEKNVDQIIGLFDKKDQAIVAGQYLNKVINPTNHDMIKIYQNNNFKGILDIEQSFLINNNYLCVLNNKQEIKIMKEFRVENLYFI